MSSFQNLRDMRTKYKDPRDAFTEEQLVSREDPFKQFQSWFEQAKTTKEIVEPNAVCLATANKDGTPSARMVLLKGYSPDGFQFFTHYTSRKGIDLIRIEGHVQKLPIEEAEQYFKSRPVPSQIGSAASDQSTKISSRNYLVNKAKDLEKIYEETGEVARPPMWGGYCVIPNMFEFWQGQSDRIHDRICFKKNETGWECYRLAP